MTRRLPRMLALAGMLLGVAAARAPEGELRYTVPPGGTLDQLAAYLSDREAVHVVAGLNHLPPGRALRAGEVLRLPIGALKRVPVAARVRFLRGSVAIAGGGRARIGSRVDEGATIVTGPDASISLALPDRSILTLPSSSSLTIRRLRRIPLTGAYERVFALQTGRSEYSVVPRPRWGARFEVHTPVSVAAVRGTVFRVSVPQDGGANAEVLRGAVAVQGRTALLDLPRGFGAHSDAASSGRPVRLLPPPVIRSVRATDGDPDLVELTPLAGARRYRVQLATDPAFTSVLAEAEAAGPAVTIPPTKVGTYYLRSTALDGQGLEGLPDTAIYYHDPEQRDVPPRR